MQKIIFLSMFIICTSSTQSMSQEGCIDLEAENINLRGSVEIMATDKETVNKELLLAASIYDLQGVQSALRRAADIDCRDPQGNTPLLLACIDTENPLLIDARIKIIEILLDEGADEKLENENGESAASISEEQMQIALHNESMQTTKSQSYFPSCWFL